jgi:hypothetical protein
MKKPPTKYVYKTPTTAKVIKPPTIKVIPNKPPMDGGPYGEAESVGGVRSVNVIGPKIYQRPQTNLKGNPSIKRPWTRLRKKF